MKRLPGDDERRRIRRYEPGDLPRLQEIRQRAFAPIFAGFRAQVGAEIGVRAFADLDTQQAKLLKAICVSNSAEVIVCIVGETIAGFASFTVDATQRTGEIGLNAVDPAYARRGIATAMYRAVLQRLASNGVEVASVSTGADAAHESARRAYAKLGFGKPIPSVSLYMLLRS